MSTVDELLEGEEVYTGSGSGSVEEHIVIGRDRHIYVPESLRKLGVQYDNNVETLTFDCPRYWDGIDLSTMVVYVNYAREDAKMGGSICTNIKVDDVDDNIVHFDWTITRHITEVKGIVRFLVCIKKVDKDGTKIYHWNSELNEDTYVSEGMECEPQIVQEYSDILTQILARLELVEGIYDSSAVKALHAKVTNIEDGTTVVGKASKDADGNVINETYISKTEASTTYLSKETAGETYATKEEVGSVAGGSIQEEITKIITGDTVVGKASADSEGNVIKETYISKTEASQTYATKEEVQTATGDGIQAEIEKLTNGTTVVGKANEAATASVAEAIKCLYNGESHPMAWVTKAQYAELEASGGLTEGCYYVITDEVVEEDESGTTFSGKLYVHRYSYNENFNYGTDGAGNLQIDAWFYSSSSESLLRSGRELQVPAYRMISVSARATLGGTYPYVYYPLGAYPVNETGDDGSGTEDFTTFVRVHGALSKSGNIWGVATSTDHVIDGKYPISQFTETISEV